MVTSGSPRGGQHMQILHPIIIKAIIFQPAQMFLEIAGLSISTSSTILAQTASTHFASSTQRHLRSLIFPSLTFRKERWLKGSLIPANWATVPLDGEEESAQEPI